MRNSVDRRDGDHAIAALANAQYGVVDLAGLRARGVGRDKIARRVAAGRLHPVHQQVWAVGHAVLSREASWLAAVLACGPGAALSHRSAGALWGLLDEDGTRPDVTVRSYAGRLQPRICVHRSTTLDPLDTVVTRGIPVTSVARTLLDLAEVLPRPKLARVVERSEVLRLFDLEAVEDVLARAAGRRGRRPLADALVRFTPDTTLTRSELEALFLDLCRDHGLPRPAVNVRVEGLEVDFAWREHRLVAELDGHRYHGTRAAFERDRARDARLLVAGYRVVRFTHRQVTREPETVVTTLRSLLELA